MEARIFYTKIWKDEFFVSLTNSEKLLFIYFLFNERVNLLACYELTTREIMFDTGLSDETIRTAKLKFGKAKKMFFKENYVLLKNAEKYQKYEGEKNSLAKTKLFGNLPPLIQRWYKILGDTL